MTLKVYYVYIELQLSTKEDPSLVETLIIIAASIDLSSIQDVLSTTGLQVVYCILPYTLGQIKVIH